MADSEPAVYSAPVASGLLASAAQSIRPNTKLIARLVKTVHQLSYAAARFLPAPRVHEAR